MSKKYKIPVSHYIFKDHSWIHKICKFPTAADIYSFLFSVQWTNIYITLKYYSWSLLSYKHYLLLLRNFISTSS